MENPNNKTPSGTPPEAAADGLSVDKSALIAEALALSKRLLEIEAELAPSDFTANDSDAIAVRLYLFQTGALGCWADYRTPDDVVERFDGEITRDQAIRALEDCQHSEYLSDDIYRAVGDYVSDVIAADKKGGAL